MGIVRYSLAWAMSFIPALAFAVTLPFSSTYNCAEQEQGDGTWVNCDGISSYGGWTTANGTKEKITSAANYSGGGGGRGQRHAIGNSGGAAVPDNTNGSGSTQIDFTEVQEIYIRWYVRWESGLKLGNATTGGTRNHKMIYFAGGYCGMGGGCYFDLRGTEWAIVVAGTPYTDGTGWDGLFGCSGHSCPSDGRWIAFEIRVKNETGGANNGIFQLWIDGTLSASITNIDFAGSTGFSGFLLPENHQFETPSGDAADSYEDIDDVAIQTTGPIGEIGSQSLLKTLLQQGLLALLAALGLGALLGSMLGAPRGWAYLKERWA